MAGGHFNTGRLGCEQGDRVAMDYTHNDNITRFHGKGRAGHSEPERPLVLTGLRPDNPLGFLAALGTLRTLDEAEPESEWELCWNDCAELLRRKPAGVNPSEDDVVNALLKVLGRDDPLFNETEPWKCKDLESIDAYKRFSGYVVNSVQNDHATEVANLRRSYDFLASLSCVNSHSRSNDDPVVKSKFIFVIGNATYFGNIRKLSTIIKNNPETLRRSLFHEWDYKDDKTTLDLDPISLQRQQAKSIGNPSGKYNPTMHGANRLAVEGISLYPVVNGAREVHTIGWHGETFTWPVWFRRAGLDEVRSILCTKYNELSSDKRQRIGITTLYSSTRRLIDSKGHRRMTPGRMC